MNAYCEITHCFQFSGQFYLDNLQQSIVYVFYTKTAVKLLEKYSLRNYTTNTKTKHSTKCRKKIDKAY